jgi:DNA-binding response OmpR family regulator
MSHQNCILIVDDEPNVRLMFRTALESTGAKISEADGGQAALDTLASTNFDLVLLDLSMPGIDGMQTLERMRERGDNTPVVIITAHGTVPHAVEAMKLGAIDFLSKPLLPDSLRHVVTDVCSRGHKASRTLDSPLNEVVGEITVEGQFHLDLTRAKRAINRRDFTEAEIYLKQALALKNDSAEAHNLMGVLLELRNQHDASYKAYRAALKVDSHYEPAKHNMTRYYERFTFGSSKIPLDTGSLETT